MRQFAVPGRIAAIVQGHDGFLWVGSTAGLFRFDGVTFRNLPDRDGRFIAITALAVTANGDVWAAADTLLRFRHGVLAAFDTGQYGSFTALAADGDILWALSTSGVHCFRDGQHELSLSGVAGLRAISRANDGTIWFGGLGGLARIVSGRAEVVATDKNVIAIAPSGARDVVFSLQGGGLARWPDGSAIANLPFTPEIGQLVDHDGALWIGSGAGIIVGRNDVYRNVLPDIRMPQAPPTALHMDREHSLWIGMGTAGLAQLRADLPIVPLNLSAMPNVTFGCAADGDGVWALDPLKGLIFADATGTKTVPFRAGFASYSARGLLRAKDGSLWMGSLHDGAARMRNAVVQEVPCEAPRPEGIKTLFEDDVGAIWAAPERGGLLRFDGRALVLAPGAPSGGERIVDIASNRQAMKTSAPAQKLALLSETHLRLWSNDHWSGHTPRLTHVQMMGLTNDEADGYWIAGGAAGLLHFAEDSFIAFGVQNGIPLSLVEGVARVADGALLLASREGVTLLTSDDLKTLLGTPSATIIATRWDAWDGLPSSTAITGWTGTLASAGEKGAFVSTNGGAVWIPRVASLVPPSLPDVVIESAEVDGLSVLNSANDFARGASRFVATFTAPTFLHAHRLRFKYRLRGFQVEWLDAGEVRQAVYPNLPPGRYVFEAAVSTSQPGAPAVSTVKSLSFTIQPVFYKSRWVQATAIAVALGAAGMVVLARRRQRGLAVAALAAERERIAHDLHDTLEQTLVAAAFQMEAATARLDNPEAIKGHMARARALIKEGMTQARRSIWSLQGVAAAPQGLVQGLALQLGEMLRGTGVSVTVHSQGEAWTMSGAVISEIERLVGEAVTNALKHAHPSKIEVNAAFSPHLLVLTVRDDGCGFSTEAVPPPGPLGGHGLGGMHARASRLKATLRVESTVDVGTTISLHLPRPSP